MSVSGIRHGPPEISPSMATVLRNVGLQLTEQLVHAQRPPKLATQPTAKPVAERHSEPSKRSMLAAEKRPIRAVMDSIQVDRLCCSTALYCLAVMPFAVLICYDTTATWYSTMLY